MVALNGCPRGFEMGSLLVRAAVLAPRQLPATSRSLVAGLRTLVSKKTEPFPRLCPPGALGITPGSQPVSPGERATVFFEV